MLLLDFVHSTEFYILMALAAAVVLGFCVRPAAKGEVRTFLYPGILLTDNAGVTAHGNQGITLTCLDDRSVELRRYGLRGSVTTSGAVSIAVSISGFDVTITERLTPAGHGSGDPVDVAVFMLNCLGRDYYHLRYVSERGLCVLTLHNRPGISTSKSIEA